MEEAFVAELSPPGNRGHLARTPDLSSSCKKEASSLPGLLEELHVGDVPQQRQAEFVLSLRRRGETHDPCGPGADRFNVQLQD